MHTAYILAGKQMIYKLYIMKVLTAKMEIKQSNNNMTICIEHLYYSTNVGHVGSSIFNKKFICFN